VSLEAQATSQREWATKVTQALHEERRKLHEASITFRAQRDGIVSLEAELRGKQRELEQAKARLQQIQEESSAIEYRLTDGRKELSALETTKRTIRDQEERELAALRRALQQADVDIAQRAAVIKQLDTQRRQLVAEAEQARQEALRVRAHIQAQQLELSAQQLGDLSDLLLATSTAPALAPDEGPEALAGGNAFSASPAAL
jgi:chromosome segregation ATPase